MNKLCWMFCFALVACSGDGAPRGARDDCGHGDIPQLISAASAPAQPAGQEGDLGSVLLGVWQQTWIVEGDDGVPDAVSDADSDLRFGFPDINTFIYCQQVDILGEEARVNSANMTLEGDFLNNGVTGYTALSWTSDVMVFRNEFFTDRDERFILERLE